MFEGDASVMKDFLKNVDAAYNKKVYNKAKF